MSDLHVVTFLLANEAYCIPVSCVQEIQGYHVHPAPRKVPDTPDFFEGLIDLRGQVVPVLDLRRRFGLGQIIPSRKTCYIIVDAGSDKVGVLVDAVMEVRRVGEHVFKEPPPRIRMAVSQDYVLGVGKMASKSAGYEGERMVILLDVERLISLAPTSS